MVGFGIGWMGGWWVIGEVSDKLDRSWVDEER